MYVVVGNHVTRAKMLHASEPDEVPEPGVALAEAAAGDLARPSVVASKCRSVGLDCACALPTRHFIDERVSSTNAIGVLDHLHPAVAQPAASGVRVPLLEHFGHHGDLKEGAPPRLRSTLESTAQERSNLVHRLHGSCGEENERLPLGLRWLAWLAL